LDLVFDLDLLDRFVTGTVLADAETADEAEGECEMELEGETVLEGTKTMLTGPSVPPELDGRVFFRFLGDFLGVPLLVFSFLLFLFFLLLLLSFISFIYPRIFRHFFSILFF